MSMLWITAWRNLWRNKRRTIILIAAITVGLFGVLANIAFINAWLADTVKTSVSTTVGHIQVQAQGYYDNPQVKKNLPQNDELLQKLAHIQGATGATMRMRGQVLLSNAEKAEMGQLIGVMPDREPGVSLVPGALIDGRWLEPGDRNKIVVGEEFLNRFKTKLNRRVIVRGNDATGEVSDALFKIVGVYRTTMKQFDRANAYVSLADAQSFFATPGRVTEYVLNGQAPLPSLALEPAVIALMPDDTHVVTTWQDQLPLVVEMMKFTEGFLWYFLAFFYVAMAFGIANSLLMVVHERTKEIGMMLALGVPRRTILQVILIEALLLAVVGAVVGNALSYGIVAYFEHAGLDLTKWAEGMNEFNMSGIIFPYLKLKDIITATLATAFTSVVMALYPAWKASRLQPVQALRTT
ncbi:MAG TPA: FtsX-like permease family protein [bacterium]|nr:FtsX-like permease family protein [bacterium]